MFQELKILICGSLLLLILNGPRWTFARYFFNKNNENNPYYYDPSQWKGDDGDLGGVCARMFDTPNFQGGSVDFNDNDKFTNWGDWYNKNFKPQSVKIGSRCSLTLYDIFWRKQAFTRDSHWISDVSNL